MHLLIYAMRAKTRPEYAAYTEEQYKVLYYGFRFLCLFNVFNQCGRVKEICVNAQSVPSNMADNILKVAHSHYPTDLVK
jgi:hypothetical protein